MQKSRQRTLASGRGVLFTVVLALVVAVTGGTASAGVGTIVQVDLNTQLLSLNLTGTGRLPLGNDYAEVQSRITVSLFQPSNPTEDQCPTILTPGGKRSCGTAAFIGITDPKAVLQGQQFDIFSRFDVFFDVTIQDIDSVAMYGGGFPDNVTLSNIMLGLSPLGPAAMVFRGNCIANLLEDNFGCLPPPVSSVYQGHLGTVTIVFPLMRDLNNNAEDDFLRLDLDIHRITSGASRVAGNGQVIDTFSSETEVSGKVFDALVDPFFGPFILTDPATSASQAIVFAAVPEPTTFVLFGAGLGLLGLGRLWRSRKRGV